MAQLVKACQGTGEFSPRRGRQGSEGSVLSCNCSDPGEKHRRDGLGLSLATKTPLRPCLRGV